MTVKIGIPRALLFYEYSPLWITFFQRLGAKVIVSPATNKKILDEAIESSVDEACLPVKLYHGHVLAIKSQVDYIFIPRIMSIRGEPICPKFSGLPEMIKYSLNDLPPIIEVDINWHQDFRTTLYEVGKHFSKDRGKIMNAYQGAYVKYKEYEKKVQRGFLPAAPPDLKSKQKVMILGHSYNLYDSYINMQTQEKIKAGGIEVLTSEMLTGKTIAYYARNYKGKTQGAFAKKLIGVTEYLLANGNVDGIIYLSAFGCGIDSVVGNIVERMIRRKSSIPFMFLNLDEHTGEGGINTRIEAFIDLIKWRDINENNVSSYG